MTEIVLGPGAQLELRAAANWYSEQEPGLGEEFLAEIGRTLDSIVQAPERCPLWRPTRPYRRAIVHRFPYFVFYVYAQDKVRVLAVAHQRRKPGYWLRRNG